MVSILFSLGRESRPGEEGARDSVLPAHRLVIEAPPFHEGERRRRSNRADDPGDE
jgi:hypothetical protein